MADDALAHNLNIREVQSFKDWRNLKALYKASFPANERKPILVIKRLRKQGIADVLLIENNYEFIGLAIIMKHSGIELLDYFAICPAKRNQGLGSQALKLLQQMYTSRFILEIERSDSSSNVSAEELSVRKRRKNFYIRNGMTPTNVGVSLWGVEMEILSHNCSITFDEYYSFYHKMVGDKLISNVKKCDLPIIAACGNDCSVCPRHLPKSESELQATAELWYRCGYRDSIVSTSEIACNGCKPTNHCRYNIVKCVSDHQISHCGQCSSYPCSQIKSCFEATKTWIPHCEEVCSPSELSTLQKAFWEKEQNLTKPE